jgi:aminoglycoside phosphotransferase family enzyme/predicted kinase
MTPDLPPLLQALLDPALYPAGTDSVTCVQTHGAWVLLAGEYAYKIKKPVQFSFMDFSTLAQRHQACKDELRVNQRYRPTPPTPALYLDVLPILGSPRQPRWGPAGEEDAQAIEYAVHMRRFDEAQRLDHVCQRGALRPEHLTQLATDLVGWQQGAQRAPAESPWGHAEQLWALIQDNMQTLGKALAHGPHAPTLASLQQWFLNQWPRVAQRLRTRRVQGRVHEGHGDLHLANLVLLDHQVLPFDAIEFNENLRWVDDAHDVAFLWMDLQHQGHAGLAHGFLSEWLDRSGDVEATGVLPLLATHLALVRGKIAAIRAAQVKDTQAQAALNEALVRYLALAHRLACPEPPRLLITHGLSGSGKSVAARRWLGQQVCSRVLHLRSDVERKRLHDLPLLHRSSELERVHLYGKAANRRTYDSLYQRARLLLEDGWTVVVDAAFLRRTERNRFARLALDIGCPFAILAPQAPIEVLRDRILRREQHQHDPSEATVAVLELQRQRIEPLAPDEPLEPWP